MFIFFFLKKKIALDLKRENADQSDNLFLNFIWRLGERITVETKRKNYNDHHRCHNNCLLTNQVSFIY